MNAQDLARKIADKNPTKQICLLAKNGNCWWDILLDELLLVRGFGSEVRALMMLAFKEMKTETWEITMMCVRHQELLQRIEKADKAELAQLMRETTP